MRKLNRPRGRIWDVQLTLDDPPFARPGSRRGRKGAGLRYEEAVLGHLSSAPGLIPKPWLSYKDDRSWEQWCQPDALAVDPWASLIVIIEVKYQHVPEACLQLFDIYHPVVRACFPSFRSVECVEVVRWFEPTHLCPLPPRLCRDPFRPHVNAFNVHIWKP
jgi:hypothetical protein